MNRRLELETINVNLVHSTHRFYPNVSIQLFASHVALCTLTNLQLFVSFEFAPSTEIFLTIKICFVFFLSLTIFQKIPLAASLQSRRLIVFFPPKVKKTTHHHSCFDALVTNLESKLKLCCSHSFTVDFL